MKSIPFFLNNALGFNIDRVAKLFRQGLTHALADFDLTPEQWQVMAVLWDSDEALNQQEITRLTLKDRHSISRLIKRLEAKGWLIKSPDPQDARAFLISATPKARTEKEAVMTALYSHFERLDLGITEEEELQLLNMLQTIRTRFGDDDVLEEKD
ncbi:MAG: MarR family winged helix-turn-helix transcriptional regulator [Aggregatilineales bacterium]